MPKDTRLAGSWKSDRYWADVVDSRGDCNNSKACCDSQVPGADVEVQVTCNASEVEERDTVAGAFGGTRERRGKRSKGHQGS